MSLGKVQRDSFEDRLKRIDKGAPNTMGEVHIGPRDEVRAKKASRSKPSNTIRIKKKKKNVNIGEGSNWVLVPVAFVIGGLCMFAGQAAAYHFFGGGLFPLTLPTDALEPVLPYAHFILAALLAMVFTWTFGFSNKKRKFAVLLGLAAVFYFEGDLVKRYPDTYAAMYSEGYAAEAREPKMPGLIEQVMDYVPEDLVAKAREIAQG